MGNRRTGGFQQGARQPCGGGLVRRPSGSLRLHTSPLAPSCTHEHADRVASVAEAKRPRHQLHRPRRRTPAAPIPEPAGAAVSPAARRRFARPPPLAAPAGPGSHGEIRAAAPRCQRLTRPRRRPGPPRPRQASWREQLAVPRPAGRARDGARYVSSPRRALLSRAIPARGRHDPRDGGRRPPAAAAARHVPGIATRTFLAGAVATRTGPQIRAPGLTSCPQSCPPRGGGPVRR